jgi:hypothetical protein
MTGARHDTPAGHGPSAGVASAVPAATPTGPFTGGRHIPSPPGRLRARPSTTHRRCVQAGRSDATGKCVRTVDLAAPPTAPHVFWAVREGGPAPAQPGAGAAHP